MKLIKSVSSKQVCYGAALSSLAFVGAAHSASAALVDLVFTPGSLAFGSATNSADIQVTTTGGIILGDFIQYNDDFASFNPANSFTGFGDIGSFKQVNAGDTFQAGSATSSNGLGPQQTGNVYIGFETASGNLGWIKFNFGFPGDTITYQGKYETDSSVNSILVGASVPESGTTAASLLGGLAVLAAGSYIRNRGKK